MKGIEILRIDPAKLLGVTQEVTGKSELTDSRNREISPDSGLEQKNLLF